MKRYHKKIYFPHKNELKIFNDSLNIASWQYSRHALDRIKEQLEYKDIQTILKNLVEHKLNENNIFEYYEENGIIKRACYRIESGKYKHIILVISDDKTLITIYSNNAGDNHITLNKSLYTEGV